MRNYVTSSVSYIAAIYRVYLAYTLVYSVIGISSRFTYAKDLDKPLMHELPSPRDVSIPTVGEYDREELKKLTEFRQRHRKTTEGSLCAAAFVRNGNKFTDCTATEAPDGSAGREWCYVEVQLIGLGLRDWGFCAGVIDYDVLRAKAGKLATFKAHDIEYSIRQLKKEERHLDNILSHFEELCGKWSESHEVDIKTLETSLRGIERAIEQLEANAKHLEILKTNLNSLEEDVEASRESSLHDRKNCALVRGYSPSEIGDGIRGIYYGNPFFKGNPLGFINHANLSLVWDEFVPVDGVEHESFSVRLEGFLKAPVTDVYTFSLRGDCNVRVFLDNEKIMSEGFYEKSQFEAELGPVATLPLDGRKTSNITLKSRPLRLIGGNRYQILVEYSHQKVLKYHNPEVAKLILSWSMASRPAEQVISAEYFFRGREASDFLVISGLRAQFHDLAILENGAQAFSKLSFLVVADIPERFKGARMIRSSVKPTNNFMSFEISKDAFVYVAVPSNSTFIPKNGAGATFGKTGDSMSVYAMGQDCAVAARQDEFTIYVKRFDRGTVKLELAPETSTIVFVIPSLVSGVCQGDVGFLPLKEGDSCVASSSVSDEKDCTKGFGLGVWEAAKGKTVGESMTRHFGKFVELHYFHFSPSGGEAVNLVTFRFPDGSDESFKIDGRLRYEFEKLRVIDWIRIEISQVADTDNKETTVGGTFALFGVECVEAGSTDVDMAKSIDVVFCRDGTVCGSSPLVDIGLSRTNHGKLYYGWRTPQDFKDKVRHGTKKEAEKGILFGNNGWLIDVPSHGRYRMMINLGAISSEVEHASLFVNNFDILSGEFLQVGQHMTYYGLISLERVGTVEITSPSAGLGILNFSLVPTASEI